MIPVSCHEALRRCEISRVRHRICLGLSGTLNRRFMAASAISRCVWPERALRSNSRNACVIKSSMKKCRQCRAASRNSAAAMKTLMTRFAIILLVVDLIKSEGKSHGVGRPTPTVVGTYRVLRQDVAEARSDFTRLANTTFKPLLSVALAGLSFHGAWPVLRACALSQQANRRTSLAWVVDLCARTQNRRHAWVRQLRGHRPR